MKKLIKKWALKNAIDHKGKAVVGAVIPKVIGENSELKSKIKELMPLINRIVKEVNEMTLEKQIEELKKIAPELLIEKKKEEKKELPELKNAEIGKVVMRLAPFPSGPLHIGNARMVILNDEYVKRYKGKLYLVFDDTVGTEKTEIKRGREKTKLRLKEIDPKAYKLIPEGLKWLGVKVHKKLYKSDRVKIYQKYCEKLIKLGGAYVCTCSADEFRNKYKNKGKACPHRYNSIEENLKEWKKMLKEYKAGEAVVRLKTKVDHPNPALRDPAIMRISEKRHPRVGKKYRVWPLMEFSWAIDDHLLGMTHILRGKDLIKEDYVEKEVWKYFGWPFAEFIHYGYISLLHGSLSKSKLAELIKKGEIKDWYDPRTWTLQSLMVRGIQPEAVREFILSFGLSQSDITADVEILYAKNRELIDPKADRYFFVKDPITLRVRDIPKNFKVKIQKHPDYKRRGYKEYKLRNEEVEFLVDKTDFIGRKQGDELRLMDLMNIKLEVITPKEVIAQFVQKEYKPGLKVIHWVIKKEAVPIEVLMVDGSVEKGFGEKEMKKLKVGDIIQLIRFGYARVDKKGKEIKLRFTHD